MSEPTLTGQVAWCAREHIPVVYSVGELVETFPARRLKDSAKKVLR